jgi:hypothetical protein
MEWKDISSHSRLAVDKTPHTFSSHCGPVRLIVLSKHLHYPGKWVGAAYPLFDIHELKATTLEEAKAEVAQAALKWIETAQKYLNL